MILNKERKLAMRWKVEEGILEGKKGKSEDYIFDVRANTNDGDFSNKTF